MHCFRWRARRGMQRPMAVRRRPRARTTQQQRPRSGGSSSWETSSSKSLQAPSGELVVLRLCLALHAAWHAGAWVAPSCSFATSRFTICCTVVAARCRKPGEDGQQHQQQQQSQHASKKQKQAAPPAGGKAAAAGSEASLDFSKLDLPEGPGGWRGATTIEYEPRLN